MSKPRKAPLGNKNIVGAHVACLRKNAGLSQRELAAKLQCRGVDICESSLSRLEGQTRRVQDYELAAIADSLGVPVNILIHRGKF